MFLRPPSLPFTFFFFLRICAANETILMRTVTIEPLFHLSRREIPSQRFKPNNQFRPLFLTCYNSNNNAFSSTTFSTFHHTHRSLPHAVISATDTPTLQSPQCSDVYFTETFPINRTELVEGKIFVKLDNGNDGRSWELIVGCNLPGKWILHWGVFRVDDAGREWDQPPPNMIPAGSVPIKDYAIQTPLTKSSVSAEGDTFHEVRIDLKSSNKISAINFVLKDEETGAWYNHNGRDFKVPLIKYLKATKRGFSLWAGNLAKMLFKSKTTVDKDQDQSSESTHPEQENCQLEGVYIEVPITKKVSINNSVSVSIKKCYESETFKNLLYFETDLPGDIVLHWGVCRDDSRRWEAPPAPHPPDTVAFKDKALRTKLQPGDGTKGSSVLITLGEEFSGFLFVVKHNENNWFKCKGNDFYIPLSSSNSFLREDQSQGVQREVTKLQREATKEASQEPAFFSFTDGIINEIRNLVTDISSDKNRKTKSKEPKESILQEIERLAAEAYNIFRSSIPTFSVATIVEPEAAVELERLSPVPKICPGTGSGYEILCQGFNWESHKSGRCYMELKDKASELASLGFSVIWLPPPTESVSPEGYLPKDLYNLNSRYGNIDELKDLVKTFHEVGIKALGDAVLNHRCAHYQNGNGIWNVFGGRLNWDDQAIVADDPHFQGKGNKSSGDNFHAAPNIDHSQEFVRKDIKEWLCWLRLISALLFSLIVKRKCSDRKIHLIRHSFCQ